ncbi:PLAC8-domain-containing protein [Rickenella mellea]|uniref:PLAC8-domain-containing protein n=1 Tax=Rickenella mellea TaxID=50990 RepID=A0A4Y7QA59_9AGAM|nr:PLAC8-domain-containing protein [Rickenella mellea]
MDPKNAKGIPYGADGNREWSNGLFGCFDDCGTCLLSWCCPCIVYAQNKSRYEHLDRQNGPHPSGGDSCNGDCFIHGCLTFWGCGWVLQMGQRGTLRHRYRISGGGCGDCLTACCCTPCELTQEAREIELEESVYRGNFKA